MKKKYNITDTSKLDNPDVILSNKEKIRCFKLCYKINKANPFRKKYKNLINKLFQKNITDYVKIRQPLHIVFANNLQIGKGVFINHNFTCMARAKVIIEDDVFIGPNVSILTANHDFINHKIIKSSPIHIGKNVWIGANATILPGVKIGENAVVGAGSVVTKDVEPFLL